MIKGLIVEGPDGSGKTFTAEYLSSAVGFPLVHSGGPPKNHIEIFNRALKQIQMENVVMDRCVIITDMVYSPVIRGEHLFEDHWLKLVKLPVIYCRPSMETILRSELVTKPHKNQQHLDKVKERIESIIVSYDLVMDKIPHIKFDRDKETVSGLLGRLRRMSCAESTCLSEKTM